MFKMRRKDRSAVDPEIAGFKLVYTQIGPQDDGTYLDEKGDFDRKKVETDITLEHCRSDQ